MKPAKKRIVVGAFRPLCLLSTVGKLLEEVLSTRLAKEAEAGAPF